MISEVATTTLIAEGARRPRLSRAAAASGARRLSLGAVQIAAFSLLNLAGTRLVEAAGLSIPGNLVGMAALYALLAFGIVRATWFEPSGAFLTRHLAFFFVPITVGLMDSGALFMRHGMAILATLVVSAAVGILLAGRVSQLALR